MKKLTLITACIVFALSSFCQQNEYLITSYGAKADGKTNNASFIQKAIDEASANGGGKVVIPPGNFVSGVLILKSDVNLHLEQGACLQGSVNRMDYNNPIAMAFLVAHDQIIRLGHRNKKAEVGSVKGIRIANVKAEIPLYKPDQGYPLEGPPDVNSPDKEKMPARRSGYPFFGHPWLPFNLLPSSIVGIPDFPVQDVVLENIEITYTGSASKEIACIAPDSLTTVPECESDYPEFSMFGELPAWGFYVRHAEGIQMKNVKVSYKEDDFRPAMVFDDVKGINLDSVDILTAKEMPVVLLNNVSGEKMDGLKIPVDRAAGIRKMNK